MIGTVSTKGYGMVTSIAVVGGFYFVFIAK